MARLKGIVVEDDALLARAVQRCLQVRAAATTVASNAAEARAVTESFDLGVFDIDLPDGDGLQVAEELLRRGTVALAVFFTGRDDPDLLERAREIGPLRARPDPLDRRRHAPARRLTPGRRLQIAVALTLVAACSREPRTLEQRGAGVFARACAGCHGHDGRGTSRPGYRVPPRDLTTAEAAALSDAHIVQVIREGKGQMPPFGKLLPEEDVGAVVAFIRTLHRAGTGGPAQSASATSAP